jgi:hypothetical protein
MITIQKREKVEIVKPQYNHNTGVTSITRRSEIGEALDDINKDEIDHTTMSSIDLRANLHPIESCGLLAMDTLVSFNIIPKHCLSFTRQKKRLSVSTQGKFGIGRTQTVDIVVGKKQEDKPVLGTLDKLKGVFGSNEKQ